MTDSRQQLPGESPNDIMQANLLLQSLLNLGMVKEANVVKKELAKRKAIEKETKVLIDKLY